MANTLKIKNNEARVHTIGYRYGKTAGGNAMGSLQLRLLPGINEVETEAWDHAKKLPVVAHYIKTKVFEEIGQRAPGLSGLSVSDAIAMIKETLDRDLLKQWKGAETRDPVITALELQIDDVTYHPERDSSKPQGAEGFDLQPRSAQQGLDGAEVANQVQNSDAPPPLEDVPAPAPTPSVKGSAAKKHGKR